MTVEWCASAGSAAAPRRPTAATRRGAKRLDIILSRDCFGDVWMKVRQLRYGQAVRIRHRGHLSHAAWKSCVALSHTPLMKDGEYFRAQRQAASHGCDCQ